MLPNFRFNKKITKSLSLLPKPEHSLTLTQLQWHSENSTKVFGNILQKWFRNEGFFISYAEDITRLFHVDGKGFCEVFAIDNIEEFLNKVNITQIPYKTDEVYHLLKKSSILPLKGMVICEDSALRVYDHKNY